MITAEKTGDNAIAPAEQQDAASVVPAGYRILTPVELLRRRKRAVALAFVLLFFVVLVFITSIVQFSNFLHSKGP